MATICGFGREVHENATLPRADPCGRAFAVGRGGGGGGFQRNAGQGAVDAYFAGGTGGICPEPPALCPWAGQSAGGAAGGVPGSPDPDAWAAAMGGGAGPVLLGPETQVEYNALPSDRDGRDRPVPPPPEPGGQGDGPTVGEVLGPLGLGGGIFDPSAPYDSSVPNERPPPEIVEAPERGARPGPRETLDRPAGLTDCEWVEELKRRIAEAQKAYDDLFDQYFAIFGPTEADKAEAARIWAKRQELIKQANELLRVRFEAEQEAAAEQKKADAARAAGNAAAAEQHDQNAADAKARAKKADGQVGDLEYEIWRLKREYEYEKNRTHPHDPRLPGIKGRMDEAHRKLYELIQTLEEFLEKECK
jgi:hypothetical protein